jgi:hypothetical protein
MLNPVTNQNFPFQCSHSAASESSDGAASPGLTAGDSEDNGELPSSFFSKLQ